MQCNNLTHMTTLENLMSLSGQSQILANSESLAHGLIGYPWGNKTSLYLDATLYELNCSSDPLINYFAKFFRNSSRCLSQ